MKKMLPNRLGSALGEVLAGDVISDTYVYTFQGEYDPDTGLRGGENPKHYVDHRAPTRSRSSMTSRWSSGFKIKRRRRSTRASGRGRRLTSGAGTQSESPAAAAAQSPPYPAPTQACVHPHQLR